MLTKHNKMTNIELRADKLLKKQLLAKQLFSKKSYLGYIIAIIKSSPIPTIYTQVINTVRRYTFITTSLKIIAFIFIIVQSSTFFLSSTSAIILSVLITLTVSYVIFLLTFVSDSIISDQFKKSISQKKLYILFPPKGNAFSPPSYFLSLIHDISKIPNTLIIIVSPYWLSSYGTSNNKKFFFILRQDAQNVVIVRRHYYFSLKRKNFFSQNNIVEIY